MSRAPRALHGVEDDRARIAALAAAHDVGTDPFGPQLELLGGRGAERVAGGHHDGASLGELPLADLADGGGLADAVHADEQPHVRLAGLEVERPVAGEPLLDLVLHRVDQTRPAR